MADLGTQVNTDITKVKSIWTHYELYIVAGVCFIVGLILGHKI